VIFAAFSLVALLSIILLLLRENRRLTNLLLAKNPSAAIAAEKFMKPTKKEPVDPKSRTTWHSPIEGVGP
jgi:hypothetical protein